VLQGPKHNQPVFQPGPLVPDVAEGMLRAAGVRMTPQRRVVLQILDGNRTHPTAAAIVEEARKRLGCVSVATIYNTLETLVEMGLVRRLDVMESSVHFDPDTAKHHHFVCRRCHRVLDLPAGSALDLGSPDGHLVEDIILKGICAECGSDKSN
jgi:Fur family transcriptional regulator, peroxide stress response regulator